MVTPDPMKDRLRASRESGEALGKILEEFRDRLLKLARFRLDPRLRGRVDASDVIQETFLEAFSRVGDYVEGSQLPFFLWLRLLTFQKLAELHRRHLGTQKRDAGRDRSLHDPSGSPSESGVLADLLLDSGSTPSDTFVRAERKALLIRVLDGLPPLDREILELRHFEQLTNEETACLLGISETASRSRYFRALKRLKEVLEDLGGLD